jgi:hypothetical protein
MAIAELIPFDWGTDHMHGHPDEADLAGVVAYLERRVDDLTVACCLLLDHLKSNSRELSSRDAVIIDRALTGGRPEMRRKIAQAEEDIMQRESGV